MFDYEVSNGKKTLTAKIFIDGTKFIYLASRTAKLARNEGAGRGNNLPDKLFGRGNKNEILRRSGINRRRYYRFT